jgi:hypothetical protein
VIVAPRGLPKHPLGVGGATLLAFCLSGCINNRVFTETELNDVGRVCGVAPGEVVQEPDEPRYLFLFAIGPTREQVGCVNRWARRHNMHLSWIEAVDFTE